jgi:diaminohydroxyphosphoribosylaminopyrimidine deaminase/5-amino-6-(5-phosphoribosylamino)uracil reductase
LLKESTLYVSLEPCAHFGKTPPCTDLIIRGEIPQVIIGTPDPSPQVAGKGIEGLTKAGIQIRTGVLEKKCIELNRRFFTFHTKKRPYILLKWAQTADGFIGLTLQGDELAKKFWISNRLSRRFVHKCRAEEDAILVGTTTASADNPALTVRDWSGKNPLRIVIDRSCRLPQTLKVFDRNSATIVFNGHRNEIHGHIKYVALDFNHDIPAQILEYLHNNQVQSLMVEGGATTLRSFIEKNLWDEAHIYQGPGMVFSGTRAPEITGNITDREYFDDTLLTILRNDSEKL